MIDLLSVLTSDIPDINFHTDFFQSITKIDEERFHKYNNHSSPEICPCTKSTYSEFDDDRQSSF